MRILILILLINCIILRNASGQQKIYSVFDNFEKEILNSKYGDTLVLLNFWATWCAPCVEELPLLKETVSNPPYTPYKLIFVSLDGAKDKIRLRKFILKNLKEHDVISLTDNKYNKWLGRVDTTWSGSIPASLILLKDRKLFLEKKFDNTSEIYTDLSIWLSTFK